MPATSPEAIARKNAARYQRQRLARGTITPYRPNDLCRLPRDPEARKAIVEERRVKKYLSVPFIACDGEGIGEKGNEAYVLFRIGDRELYRDDRPLETHELLSFILASPPPNKAILTAFAFDYDVANILRDLKMVRDRHDVPSRIERILRLHVTDMRQPLYPQWTWLILEGCPDEFGVMYLPRHYFKVCYAEIRPDENGDLRRYSKKGSIRTIWDGFRFFQTSFLNAINQWDIGEKHWHVINRMKRKRGKFLTIDEEVRRYNQLECELLSELMGKLREATFAAGIKLTKWDGAGQIANVMLKDGGAMKREEVEKRLQKGVIDMAHAAYYGGRFEVTRIGAIGEPVIGSDINSAYPAALQQMPCHLHGKWRKVPAATLQDMLGLRDFRLFIAPVTFTHPRGAFLCGLPFRQKSGTLAWPQAGRGTYWSPELRSAKRLGATIHIEGPGWLYEQRCSCTPYAFLKRAYDARKALGKSTKGLPLKLGINAIYGKRAQRIGAAPWQDPVAASLTTALTRAKLNMAIAAIGPRNVIMIATDAIYTTGEAPKLDYGPQLGQWELKRYPGLFIVRPGLFWPPKEKDWQLKSRGISVKLLENKVPEFVSQWAAYMKETRDMLGDIPPDEAPKIAFMVPTFVGQRLAFHIKRFEDACKWIDTPKIFSFEWSEKRSLAVPHPDRASLVLNAKKGDVQALSLCYSRDVKVAGVDEDHDWKIDELQFEAMPDYVDLSGPHR